LAVADEWGYLDETLRFRMEKAPQKLPTYVPGDHFALIYESCEVARFPAGQPYPASDWWRGLMVTGYMTGWWLGDMLTLLRARRDRRVGTAINRWESEGNKGKRDELVVLHPVVVEHLKKLPGFTPTVFPWPHAKTFLYDHFALIQQKAGIHLP